MKQAMYTLPAIPAPLSWQGTPEQWRIEEDGGLTIQCGPLTDLFIDPQGTGSALNAPRFVGQIQGDFILSARVGVDFKATFDAGVLVLYAHQRAWAKLCFEYSPQGQPMVVSVVTSGVSDDCNSFVVDGHQVWLRVARLGLAFAFHASTDGLEWQLVRHFTFDAPDVVGLGFLVQSPTGEGCTAQFDDLGYRAERLSDIRNGE
jgi:regulation of enolase protein 1 (concanavalin A-like superfamily)